MTHNFAIQPASCPTVKAPEIYQHDACYGNGEGAGVTQLNDLPLTAVADRAFYGGRIVVDGCEPIEFTVTYIDYDNCDRYTPNAYTLEERTIRVNPARVSTISIPDGWWQNITYQINDGAGVQSDCPLCVDVYSTCQPSPCCEVFALS